ncbi:hypothetical protein F4815DRAFT_452705, partial [Daldinia loculata]
MCKTFGPDLRSRSRLRNKFPTIGIIFLLFRRYRSFFNLDNWVSKVGELTIVNCIGLVFDVARNARAAVFWFGYAVLVPIEKCAVLYLSLLLAASHAALARCGISSQCQMSDREQGDLTCLSGIGGPLSFSEDLESRNNLLLPRHLPRRKDLLTSPMQTTY